MMRALLSLLSVLAFTSMAEARVPAAAVARVVFAYGNSLGCEVHVDKNNILPYEVGGSSSFLILYSLDMGCSGGTAMSGPAFAVVTPSNYGNKFYVRPEYSNPRQTSNFPRMTNDIYLKDGKVRFRAKELANTDALCCPSIDIDGLVVFQDGTWTPESSK